MRRAFGACSAKPVALQLRVELDAMPAGSETRAILGLTAEAQLRRFTSLAANQYLN